VAIDTVPRHSVPCQSDLAEALGFRSIESVVVTRGDRGTVADVIGVLHRYPRTVRVPLPVAARLVLAGAPVVVQ
jgi:hypothetical protein